MADVNPEDVIKKLERWLNVKCPFDAEIDPVLVRDAHYLLKKQEEHRQGLVAEMDAMYSLLKEKYDTYSLIQLLSSRDGVEKTYVEPGQEYEAPFIYGPATVLVIQE